MKPVIKRLMLDTPPPWLLPNFPLKRTGTQAWWDLSDVGSLRNNAGAIPVSGDAIKLVSDKSGYSAVNVLCLDGVNGNYASSPDSAALDISGDIDIRVYMETDSWARGDGVERYAISKYLSGADHSYVFGLTGTGALKLYVLRDGAPQVSATSSVAVPFSAFDLGWIRATRVAASGTVQFFTSSDGFSWTQLGADQATATGNVFISTATLSIGALDSTGAVIIGNIHSAQIYNGIAGTLVFDANFATASKLATSFTESSVNAATVTINSTGDTGARICGARDLYWGTGAGMPVLTVTPSGNYLTGDGIDDAMRSALFSLSQPVSRYIAGSQTTWTSGDYLWDGANGANSGALIQTSGSPQVNMNAGSSVAANTDFVLTARAVISEIINGASSSLGVNRLARTTGNAGAAAPNGFTLFASGASTAANFGNGTFSECVLRSVADDATTRDTFIRYLMHKWRIPA